MTQPHSNPLSVEYAHITAFGTLENLSRMTENFKLTGALTEMYLQTVCSDGFRNAPEEGKKNLKSHFEAIESILELIDQWKEFTKDVENGLNDDDILLNFTQDRSN